MRARAGSPARRAQWQASSSRSPRNDEVRARTAVGPRSLQQAPHVLELHRGHRLQAAPNARPRGVPVPDRPAVPRQQVEPASSGGAHAHHATDRPVMRRAARAQSLCRRSPSTRVRLRTGGLSGRPGMSATTSWLTNAGPARVSWLDGRCRSRQDPLPHGCIRKDSTPGDEPARPGAQCRAEAAAVLAGSG